MPGQYDPVSTEEPTYPPTSPGGGGALALGASPRHSLDSVGSGSDLVYRDIAEEDPFEEKSGFRDEEQDEEPGFVVEPRRVSAMLLTNDWHSSSSAGRAIAMTNRS